MKTKYRKVPGSRITDADAEVIGERMEGLKEEHGDVTAETLLSDARSKRSKLHRFFVWDDGIAAHRYRVATARKLIRSVQVVIIHAPKREPIAVRAFIARPPKQKPGQKIGHLKTYEPIVEVMSKEEHRLIVIAEALEELECWRRRYEGFAELGDVYKAIDTAKRRARAVKKKRPRKARTTETSPRA